MYNIYKFEDSLCVEITTDTYDQYRYTINNVYSIHNILYSVYYT